MGPHDSWAEVASVTLLAWHCTLEWSADCHHAEARGHSLQLGDHETLACCQGERVFLEIQDKPGPGSEFACVFKAIEAQPPE
eukprot:4524504-Amphidinium_carterae.1